MVPAMQNVNVSDSIPWFTKILDKEHHFIMPIINENTLKNDKCKKKKTKNPEIHPNLV